MGFILLMLGIILAALVLLVNFVPISTIETAINTAAPYWGAADQIFPVLTVFSLVSSYVILETALLGYTVLRWVWTKVPGLN